MPQPNPCTSTRTVQETAILTSRPEWDVRDAIHQGELPAEVDGQQLRIRTDDIAVWVASS